MTRKIAAELAPATEGPERQSELPSYLTRAHSTCDAERRRTHPGAAEQIMHPARPLRLASAAIGARDDLQGEPVSAEKVHASATVQLRSTRRCEQLLLSCRGQPRRATARFVRRVRLLAPNQRIRRCHECFVEPGKPFCVLRIGPFGQLRTDRSRCLPVAVSKRCHERLRYEEPHLATGGVRQDRRCHFRLNRPRHSRLFGCRRCCRRTRAA